MHVPKRQSIEIYLKVCISVLPITSREPHLNPRYCIWNITWYTSYREHAVYILYYVQRPPNPEDLFLPTCALQHNIIQSIIMFSAYIINEYILSSSCGITLYYMRATIEYNIIVNVVYTECLSCVSRWLSNLMTTSHRGTACVQIHGI